jgi:hypothetical protein
MWVLPGSTLEVKASWRNPTAQAIKYEIWPYTNDHFKMEAWATRYRVEAAGGEYAQVVIKFDALKEGYGAITISAQPTHSVSGMSYPFSFREMCFIPVVGYRMILEWSPGIGLVLAGIVIITARKRITSTTRG